MKTLANELTWIICRGCLGTLCAVASTDEGKANAIPDSHKVQCLSELIQQKKMKCDKKRRYSVIHRKEDQFIHGRRSLFQHLV